MPAFRVEKLIRFQHCDMAGVVFVPQYFNLFNEVIEDWWEQGLGVAFNELLTVHRRGIPLRRVEGEFLAFSRLGEQVVFELVVHTIGRVSVDLQINGHGADTLRCWTKMTLVQVELSTGQVVRWSEQWRDKMELFKVS
jgi:4-hydroxybenzoyl-CoA thioesterase